MKKSETSPIQTKDIGVVNLNFSYAVSGRVTVAAVVIDDKQIGIGAAFCMPKDKFSPEIGKNIALGRALADVGERLAEQFSSYSVTKEDWKKKHSKGG